MSVTTTALMICLVAVVGLEVGKESRMIEINQVEGVIQIKISRELVPLKLYVRAANESFQRALDALKK